MASTSTVKLMKTLTQQNNMATRPFAGKVTAPMYLI